MPNHKTLYDVLTDGDLDEFFDSSPDAHGFSVSQTKSFVTLRARYLELQSIFLKGQMANEEWLREFSRIHEACVHLIQKDNIAPVTKRLSFTKKYVAVFAGLSLLSLAIFMYIKNASTSISISSESEAPINSVEAANKEIAIIQAPEISSAPIEKAAKNKATSNYHASFLLKVSGFPDAQQGFIYSYIEEILVDNDLSLIDSNLVTNYSGQIECIYKIDKKQSISGIRTDASSLRIYLSVKITTAEHRVCFQKSYQSGAYIVYPEDEEREIVTAYLHSIRSELKSIRTQNCR